MIVLMKKFYMNKHNFELDRNFKCCFDAAITILSQ